MDDLFASGVWTSVAGDYLDLVDNPRTVSTPRFAAPDDAEMDAILDDMQEVDGFKIVMSDRALQAINRDGAAASDDYRLGIEIDASGTSEWSGGEGFDPIGDGVGQFTGAFDGNGFEITELSIDETEIYVGLFGYVGTSGVVERVDLEAVDISGESSVGGLVGTNDGGEVRDSVVAGSVSGTGAVGGLVGSNSNDGSVTGSHATSSVTGTNNFIGGLVGYNRADVEDSYATGRVTGVQNVGGLVGNNEDGVVSVAYATGSVDGDASVGGLVGYNNQGEITEAYAVGPVSGDSQSGGLVGSNLGEDVSASYWNAETTGQPESAGSDDRYGLTTEQMSGLNTTVEMVEFDFTDTWRPGATAGDYPVFAQDSAFTETEDAYDVLVDGDGSVDSPYQVSNVYQLQRITMRLGEGDSFELAGNIDASRSAAWSDDGTGARGFEPIGDDAGPFTGTFNGSDFEIIGLSIDRPDESFVGVFGYVDSGGQVERVGLEAVDISGQNAVGGLVGTNDGGEVAYASVTGNVDGTGNVGGLAGTNIFDGSVSRSSATVSVTASGDWIGGLVGRNFAHVDESYATGSVEGVDKVGGLVGYHDGFVNASYATGSVDGEAIVGGLVGENEGGEVNQTYAAGPVDGDDQFGGLVGSNSGDVIESYWDIETTGQSESAGSDDRYALATEAMTGLNATVGMFEFDFEDTWRPAADSGYPDLAVNSAFESEAEAYVGLVDGDGSANSPFQVSTVYELQLIRVRLGEGDSFELVGDIDASTTAEWYDVGDGPRGFDPVGTDTDPFTGSINGSEATVSDLSINRTDESFAGLFGYVDQEGEIERVTLDSVDVLGGSSVGGLVGDLHDGTVNQSSVTGTVNGSNNQVGGLAGYIGSGSVNHSTVSATVNGSSSLVGGITGRLDGGSVTASNASGTVQGTNDVGGLFGDITNDATVSDSSANVTVVGHGRRIGGLVGDIFQDGTVSRSYASGSVEGQSYVGGLAGRNQDTLRTSFATGGVTGSDEYVGGLVGWNDGGEIANSSATGAVSGTADASDIGGLVGHNDDALISSSFAAGSVDDAGANVGGLVGAETSATTEDVYWDLNATGRDNSAGGVGLTTVNMTGVNATTTMAFDFDATWAATHEYPVLAWAIDDVNITLGADSLTAGQSTDATVALTLVDATARTATNTSEYASADTDVATIENATVRANGAGTVSLTAQVGGVIGSAQLSVTAAPSGGAGGGSRPGLELRVTDDSTIEATGARAGETVRLSGETTGDTESLDPGENIAVDGLSIELANDRDFWIDVETVERGEVNANDSESDEANRSTIAATFETETGTVSVGYVTITHNLDPDDIETVEFEFSVRQSYLDDRDVESENVTLYRQTEEWSTLSTEYAGDSDARYRFTATSPGFSSFAIGTGAAVTAVTDATLTADEITEGDATTVTATVENRGETEAEHTVELTANGETVATETLELDPGETVETTLSFEPAIGEYDLVVDEHELDSLVVAAPPNRSPAPETSSPDGEDDGIGLSVVLPVLVVASLLLAVVWRRGSDWNDRAE